MSAAPAPASPPDNKALLVMYRLGRRERLSRQDLARDINTYIGRLEKRGIGPGDRVLCIGPLSPRFFAQLVALFASGATAVLPPPVRSLRELARACRDIRPAGILAPLSLRLFLRLACPPQQQPSKGEALPYRSRKTHNKGGRPPARVRPESILEDVLGSQHEQPLLLSSTSGTGGAQHTLVRTGRDLATQSTRIAGILEYNSSEKEACGIPTFALNNIATGMEALILRPGDWRHPARLLRILRREKPDRLSASPSLVNAICRELEGRGEKLPWLRRVISGGAPIHASFIARCRACFPNARLSLVYGSTEAQPIAILDSLAQGGSESILEQVQQAALKGGGIPVGRPVSNTDILIRPLPDGRIPCTAPGGEAIGEVLVRGEGVNNRYLDVEDTDNPSRWYEPDGSWYHKTGDLGYMDAHSGGLCLVGRSALIVDSPTGPLNPYTVEALANQDPAVERAALVPAPPGARGEAGGISDPILFIQGKAPGTDIPHIHTRALRERLAEALGRVFPIKMDIVFVPQIPLDARHAWRNDYRVLRRMASERIPRLQ